MEFKTTPYEASDYLDSPEAVEAYLEAAFETNDVALISVAIARHGKRRFVVLSTEDFEALRHGTDSRTVHHVNDLDDAEALQLMTEL